MGKNYSYPLNFSWSTDEMTSVLSFLNQVEKAYEGGADRHDILSTYKRFKEIVPSRSEERQIDRDFERLSSYSAYKVVQTARRQEKGIVRLES